MSTPGQLLQKRFREIFWILFLPASFLWSILAWRRFNRRSKEQGLKSKTAVLCFGNFHSGGSGKTPLTILAARHFGGNLAKGVAIVTRGFGGTIVNSEKLDRLREGGCRKYGDEAWMMAHLLGSPIWVGDKRVVSLKSIESSKDLKLVICDDGLQDPSFEKRIRIMVISAEREVHDRYLLPLGEGRANLSEARECHAVICMGGTDPDHSKDWAKLFDTHFPQIPWFVAKVARSGLYIGSTQIDAREADAIAFCGIGTPDGFERGLARLGCKIKYFKAFPNHFSYREKHAHWLLEQARAHQVKRMVTTEKDWYKIQPLLRDSEIDLVTFRKEYSVPEEFWNFIAHRLEETRIT